MPVLIVKPLVVGAAVAALAPVACSGGGDTTSSEGAPPSDGVAGQAFDPDRAAPASPISGAAAGGTITVLGLSDFTYEMGSLDPSQALLPDAVLDAQWFGDPVPDAICV